MKKSMAVVAVVAGVIASASAQDIVIDSISGNGSMSFWGAQVGTTATVEWAASLTDTGRTNWHGLTNVVVTDDIVSTDIPMFFRVRGTPDTNLINGLIAYYPFNGNANDESGNGYNGTASGATLTSNRYGETERAYGFDGNADSIDVNLPELTTYSVNVWLYPFQQNAGGSHRIFAPYLFGKGSLEVALDQDLMFRLWSSDAGLVWEDAYPVSLPTNQWSMFTITGNGIDTKMFVNGREVYQLSTLTTVNIRHFGHSRHPSNIIGDSYRGIIDDIRIYNRALSSNEVMRLHNLLY